MALIKIQKNDKILEVSKSAFKNFYENSGWKEVGSKPTSSNHQKAHREDLNEKNINNINEKEEDLLEQSGESSDDEWEEAMSEDDEDAHKPISEMNREELIRFAKENDISLVGLSKNNQFKEAISNALKERGK